MDRQVSLAVAIQIQLSQGQALAHGLLENSGKYLPAVPQHFPRQADVQRNHSHGSCPFSA